MAKIIRTEPGAILSKAVEYHGFVYLPGITSRDTKLDIKGQTADVLAQIDAMLEHHGTDKTRLLHGNHLGEAHQGPRAANERGLDAVAAAEWRSGPGLRAVRDGRAGRAGRDHGHGV
jgi:hypothetical protein